MRVLFLSNFYPPHELGGYAQWCHEVGKGLRDRGHELGVLASNHRIPGREGSPGGFVKRSLTLEAEIDHYRPIGFFLERSRATHANLDELKRIIASFQPDSVMVWGMWNLSLWLPYLAEQMLPGRVAYYIASYWPTDTDPHRAYWSLPARRFVTNLIKHPLRRIALNRLRHEGYPPPLRMEKAVCCSRYVRDRLVESGKLPPGSTVIYGGVDTERGPLWNNSSRSRYHGVLRLVWFGRLIWDKGAHTALEALGVLKRRGLSDKVHLTIIGDGRSDYERMLRSMTSELGIERRVNFYGRVSRERLLSLLNEFDVHLFTSIWPEPMARSVMESMANGLLVIGTDVGGQREMLSNGINALTFSAEDPEDLADSICRVLDDRDLLLRLSRSGRHTVLENFSLDRMVGEIEQFLWGLCNETQRSETRLIPVPADQPG